MMGGQGVGGFLLLLLACSVLASPAGSLVDPSFDVGSGAAMSASETGYIKALALQPDGKIIVGGRFTSFSGVPCDGLVRLNSDGTVDGSFELGTNDVAEVNALLMQTGGGVLVGGVFDQFRGSACRGLVRLNPDGSVDESFGCHSEALCTVTSLVPYGDGRILVGTVKGVWRLLTDGRVDPTFATTTWTNTVVAAMAVQPDGKIVAGGPPGNYFIVPGRPGLARLNSDGSIDPSFLPRPLYQRAAEDLEVDGVTALLLEPGGRILVGGRFYGWQWDPYQSHNLIRLHPDGRIDGSFPIESLSGGEHTGLLSRPDGRTLVIGSGMSIDGLSRPGVAQLLSNGALDVGFVADFARRESREAAATTAMVLQPDGKVVIGGFFIAVDQVPRTGLVRLLDRAPSDLNVMSVAIPPSRTPFIEANTNVVVDVLRAGDPVGRVTVGYVTEAGTAETGQDFIGLGGTVTFEPGEGRKSIQIPLVDDVETEMDETFTLRLTDPSDGVSLGEHSSEEITIVDDDGFHFVADEYTVTESARDVEFAVRPGQPAVPFVVEYRTSDETAMAGRDFEARAGTLQFSAWWQDSGVRTFHVPIFDNAIADGDRSFVVTIRNPSSGLPVGPASSVRVNIVDDDTFAGAAKGVNGTIQAAGGLPDGRIVIGGWFTAVDGLQRCYVARLNGDGSADPQFVSDAGPNGPVTAIALDADGRVVIGGLFTNVAGAARARIARLSSEGQLDPTFNPGEGWQDPVWSWSGLPSVRALIVQPDGHILTGGGFTRYDGTWRPGMARLNPDGSLDRSFQPDLKGMGAVSSMALQADGKVVVAGELTNDFSDQVIRLQPNGSLDEGFESFTTLKVASLLVLANGQILVGNETSSIGSAGLVRLNQDGSRDAGFAGKTFFSERPLCLAELGDGKILAAGLFQDPNKDPGYSTGLIRLTPTGALDPTFVLSTRMTGRVLVRTLVKQSADHVFLGGTFLGRDDEETAIATGNTDVGVAISGYYPGAYHWLRVHEGGAPVNDLRFDRVKLLDHDEVDLVMSGQAAPGFIVEASDDLSHWFALATNATPNTRMTFRDASVSAAKRRFYRAR